MQLPRKLQGEGEDITHISQAYLIYILLAKGAARSYLESLSIIEAIESNQITEDKRGGNHRNKL